MTPVGAVNFIRAVFDKHAYQDPRPRWRQSFEKHAFQTAVFVKHALHAPRPRWRDVKSTLHAYHAGMTQREMARSLINPKTEKPYSQVHITYTRQAFDKFTYQTPRPKWQDAFGKLASHSLAGKPLLRLPIRHRGRVER